MARLDSVVALVSVRVLGCGLVVALKAALGSVAARLLMARLVSAVGLESAQVLDSTAAPALVEVRAWVATPVLV